MKLIKTTFAIAIALPSFAAFAGHDGDMFKSMDTDSDGRVSAAEHTVAADKMFHGMDANNDASITAAEMDAKHHAMMSDDKSMAHEKMDHEMSSAEKIKEIDKNGDGMVSKDEHADGSSMMFDKMDTDRDGSLTSMESEAGHKKMMSKNDM